MDKTNRIFNRKLLNSTLQSFDINTIPNLKDKFKIIKAWKFSIENSDLGKTKEKSVQGDFLTSFFTNILGYKKMYGNKIWNIRQEQKTMKDNTTSDGALGFFTNNINDVRVVIELKDAQKDLDKNQKGYKSEVSPVEQAFSYAPKSGKKCFWVIVSNFTEIRFYHSSNALEYEKFNVADLVNEEDFKRFYYLLCFDNLINRDEKSLIDILYEKNEKEQIDISKLFYRDYKKARMDLFEILKEWNPSKDELMLFTKTQKLMDRFVFICFCEDSGLLPQNTFRKVIQVAKMSFDISNNKIWNQLKGLFHSIDIGNPELKINRFNGGLFKDDDELNDLNIPDSIFIELERVSSYDFDTELNVNILGHIFEQSIVDIEEIKAEISGLNIEKKKGKRKKEGIFYTPEYITHYIVQQTIGNWLQNKRREMGEDVLLPIPSETEKMSKAERAKRTKIIKQHLEFLEKYRQVLSKIKVLDPACGSGAFLNQAFDFLYKEGQQVNKMISQLQGGQITLFDLDKQILKNNLFGVDLNSESVEITKLSLWLKTANKNDILTSLDDNIKCGNSLIDDMTFECTAFDWNLEFKDILVTGGFDIIIGNPPYVRQELIGKYKGYFEKNYQVYNFASDLFAYFYEKSINLLKPNGIMGFISNSFAKTTAGSELRGYLKKHISLISYTDFSDLQIFEGATTYPVIPIFKKVSPINNNFNYFKVNSQNLNSLLSSCAENSIIVSQSSLDIDNWSFQSDKAINLNSKLANFPIIKDIYGKCYYGIKTGLNKAFIIDGQKRLEIINENPDAEKIIKPYLEGKDLKKWRLDNVDKWLLIFEKGWTKNILGTDITEEQGWEYICSNYPKIAEHLVQFMDEAIKRYDKGDFWWELRACDYYNKFISNKVTWPNMQSKNKFAFDNEGYYINAPAVILPSDSKSLLCLLNSKLVWFYLKNICVVRNGGFIEVKPQYFEQIPIHIPKDEQHFIDIADELLKLNESINKEINSFINYVNCIYKPKSISSKIEEFFTVEYDEFVQELKKQKVNISANEKIELMNLFNQRKNSIFDISNNIKKLENQVDKMVYELYNLTEDEIDIIESNFKV